MVIKSYNYSSIFLLEEIGNHLKARGVAQRGKSISLQAWTGALVSRRLRLPDF
jgi:hypothetical protein